MFVLLNFRFHACNSDVYPSFTLKTLNKLGLELKVSNNGSPILQSVRQSIFAVGYTSKSTKQHSGLGLYIIQQIIDRYDSQLELREPEDYSGIEFMIYIPWNK